MMNKINLNTGLAPTITKAASRQTYSTIRFLADQGRAADAYRAYAYFRWVDDALDTEAGPGCERTAFINRQASLLEKCYRGESIRDAIIEEQMLVGLIQSDTEKNSGLQSYLRNMMAVMAFDASRRGKLISQSELNDYTRWLASAVTEAMHYFIGHGCYSPQNEARYLAVTAAHVTHMLRDTVDDIQAGYFNIPREVLDANHIMPQDMQSPAYRAWVRSRVQLARTYFKAGKQYLNQVESFRCRLAGFAYTARFETVLDLIEQDEYLLRSFYPERNGLFVMMRALGAVFPLRFVHQGIQPALESVPVRQRTSR